MSSSRPVVLVTANSAWNILNYRAGLVRALSAAGYEPVVVAPSEPHSSTRMIELGANFVPISLTRAGLNPLADIRLIMKYRSIVRRLRPAAIFAFTIKPNIYGCIAARLQSTPAIPNISGLGTVFSGGGPLKRLVVRMYRLAFRRSPVVFFQNDDDLRLFVSKGIVRRGQARRLPGSGVDLHRFTSVTLPLGPPTFLLIARLLSDKGIREYVEAARIIRSRRPEVRFQILGPVDRGNPSAILSAELASWVDEGVVDYIGETEDVRPFIAAASAIVLPSYYKEGVPRSLLEGAAMGRPLITTDFPGCRDVVRDGINGFLCAPRDPHSLVEALERLLSLNGEQLHACGQASRAIAERQFDERFVIQAYLDALTEVRGCGNEGRSLDGPGRSPR